MSTVAQLDHWVQELPCLANWEYPLHPVAPTLHVLFDAGQSAAAVITLGDPRQLPIWFAAPLPPGSGLSTPVDEATVLLMAM